MTGWWTKWWWMGGWFETHPGCDDEQSVVRKFLILNLKNESIAH
jgi:hypothetical protein